VTTQVNLHTHSEFSTLDGYSKVEDIARRTAELGQHAVALTDHGDCAGHYKFQKACRAVGVHPIFGMEGYLVTRPVSEVRASVKGNAYPKGVSHACLLARDDKGLSNLWAWSTVAYDRDHFCRRPLADPALIREYAEGLYCSDGCLMTDFGEAIRHGDEDAGRQYVSWLLDIFGDRFYMELHTWQFMEPVAAQGHPNSEVCRNTPGKVSCQVCLNQWMADLNRAKLRVATELGVPLVVVNDCHHSWPGDWRRKDLANQINKDKSDQLAEGQKADHHMGADELVFWMARHGISASVVEECIANAYAIAQTCTAEIRPMLEMPTYTDSDVDDVAEFISAVEQGFKRKVIEAGLDVEKYWRRMESEVELICQKRFCGYFLTVADYVRAAREGTWRQYVTPGADPEPMRTGPGRGSAGGALVSWLLGITAIDPIRYDLLFERFLAPGRKGYPDIDVDFPQSKLRDMYRYLQARHGPDHVCGIGTVGRNGPRRMLRDLAKPFGIPYREVDEMSKIIEQAVAIVAANRDAEEETGEEELGWDDILAEKGGDLAPYAQKYPELFEYLGEMVGVARNYGKHASGVLISDKPLLGVIPMRTRNHGTDDEIVTTQWDMYDIEELGGVKFDLLGLRHLDTLDGATRMVEQRHGVRVDFDALSEEQLSDPAVWEPVGRGQTLGLFQVETPGTTRVAVQLKPRTVNDVAALLSIIRPGVKDAGETDRYLRRRAGDEPVTFDHPLMEPIVAETYGVLVYQEQMMRAARDLAGYAPDEVDDLRKAIGKKMADKIAEHEAKFRAGCLANPAFMEPLGGDERAAERTIAKIWASINASGRYAFNKCVIGSTEVRLAASSQHTKGSMTVEEMWRRLHDLAPPGAARPGEPCRFCGRPAVAKGRGQCARCVSWRQKFRSNHPKRGLRAWSLGEDGRLHPNRIVDVHRNGVQPVWKVTLADGRSITATADHRHMTPGGWRAVAELSVGDELLVCGEYEPRKRGEKGYPVVPTAIVSIEYVGEEMTYDVEMADPHHSWVGNDIVTHNSHAVGYGLVTCQEAYLNHHYPVEYLVQLLATDPDNTVRYVRQARRQGIPILPPDINESGAHFTITDDGAIRYGLEAVKGVGAAAVRDILAKRPFRSLADFLERVDTRSGAGNKRVVVNLIKIGAFDSLAYDRVWDGDWQPACRTRLLDEYYEHRIWMRVAEGKRAAMGPEERAEYIASWYRKHRRDKNFEDEYGIPDFDNPDVVHAIETELVGTFILVDPMAPYLAALDAVAIKDPMEIEDLEIGDPVVIGGQVSKIKIHKIAKGRFAGQEMAFIGIEHNGADFDITVFSETWSQVKALLKVGAPVACTCLRDSRGVHMVSLERLDLLLQEAG